jgi:hypothetical protein
MLLGSLPIENFQDPRKYEKQEAKERRRSSVLTVVYRYPRGKDKDVAVSLSKFSRSRKILEARSEERHTYELHIK